MYRKLARFASISILVAFLSPLAIAQEDERYDFDGRSDMDPQPADPTDWMTSENWSDGGFDPDERFGPLLPGFGTRIELDSSLYGENAPVIGLGDAAQAFGIRIGRFGGEGLLTMTGGTLEIANSCTAFPFTCDRRLRVGAADVIEDESRNPGTFNLSGGTVTTDTLWIGSGSHGEMNMSGGEVVTRGNFYFDWTFDASSMLNMTAGTIKVGDVLRMYRTSSLNLDGGEIFVDAAAELGSETGLNPDFLQTPDVTVSITDGLLEVGGFLQIGGSVALNGGILRAASFNESVSDGTIEINGSGILQFDNSQESVTAVEQLIASGFFTTSEASPLTVAIVAIGGTNFTQISLAALRLPGDYNENGNVDAADYTIWRDTLESTTDLRANGDNQRGSMGIIDEADYDFWKAHFGNVSGPSSDSAGETVSAPEPASYFFWLLVLVGAIAIHRRA